MATTTQRAEEAQIRERIEAWARAVRINDLAGVVAHHGRARAPLGSIRRMMARVLERIGP